MFPAPLSTGNEPFGPIAGAWIDRIGSVLHAAGRV